MKKKILLSVLSLVMVMSCMACTTNSVADKETVSQESALNQNNEAEKEKVPTGFYVNDSFFAFSATDGVENYKDIPGAAYCEEAGKYKAEMPSVKDAALVPMNDVNVIFNVTFNGNENLNSIAINGNMAADYRYFALKNNFKVDGLEMGATAQDAVMKGYRACTTMSGLYYRTANDFGNVDMAEMEEEYSLCEKFKDFWNLPYGEEFKSLFNLEALQISEESKVSEIVEKMENYGVKAPKDTIMEKLILAKQLQLLSEGSIDYFAIKYYGFSETDGNYCFVALYTKPGETENWFDFD